MRFDHIAFAGESLEAGVAAAEEALGVPILPAVGRHPLMGTHNRLLSLGGAEYLEIIAVDPAAPPPGRARWFGLDAFRGAPRIAAWICAVEAEANLGPAPTPLVNAEANDEVGAQAKLAPHRLAGAGEVIDFQRGPYRWQMAVPQSGLLPFGGVQPAQILWQSSPPALDLPPSGCRLARLIVQCPEPEALSARLGALRDPRLVIEGADVPQIRAEIRTPKGLCHL